MTELAFPVPAPPARAEAAVVPRTDGSASPPGERSDPELLLDVVRRPRVWLLLAAYSLAINLVLTLGIQLRYQARGRDIPFFEILVSNGGVEWLSINLAQGAAFVVGWLFPLRERHWALRLGAVGALLGAVLVARHLLLNAALMAIAGAPWAPFDGFGPWIPGLMMALMLYAGAGASLRSVLRERERRLAVARLEERVAHERFRALKTQLRPRFLFDTLAAVGERMHGDVPAAERLLVCTGELLRLTFRHAEAERVPLQQELSFAMLFLEIEGVRAGRPVRFRATADREARETEVPHMSVFPLVESAVLSASGRDGPGQVEVSARRQDGRLLLEVRDDLGVALAERRGGAGWAPVEALRARLDELPGGGFALAFADLPAGGVRASLDVPLAPGAA